MDDGQYEKRGGLTLCTDSFTVQEVLLLKFVLETKFDLICTVHKKMKQGNRLDHYSRIYISTKSLPVLNTIVANFMHPSMLYKLSSINFKPVGSKVFVLDLQNNLSTTYNSVSQAAASLNCSISLIRYNQKETIQKGIPIPLKGRYIINIIKNT
jgi:LAGLIDADG DNA endonuclease family